MEQIEATPVQASSGDPAPAIERRRDLRFPVEGVQIGTGGGVFEPTGAFVRVRGPGLGGLLRERAGHLDDVKDLSCGGLRFETPQRFVVGQQLTFSLFVQGWSEPMLLRAEVRWTLPIYVDMLRAVGVQFLPFDDSRSGNPIAARDAIASLEERHTRVGA